MKQKLLNSIRLRVCMLVAVLCTAFAGQAWATVTNGDVFERISSVGDLADGDEIIFVNQAETYACGTTQNTNNRTPVAISVSDHKYTYASKDNVQVFVVKISKGAGSAADHYGFHTGSGYIYSASSSYNYLKTNSTAASTAPTGTAAWTLSVSSNVFSAINVTNTAYYLQFNSTTQFSQYKNTQSSPYIFKKQAVATALEVKTAPTKLNYKKGESLDLTGLVLDATVGGNHVDVTSGYTASPANGATLNSVGAQTVTFTYGGQNTTQTIHVGDLKSIALNTTGVKTTYDEGQTFDPENLVVTATYSDGETTPTEWNESVDLGDCTFDPDGALETTDDNVTVSYTLGSTTKTADIAITVNAASAYTVTFNAGTGSCGTSSLTEASPKAGVTLPTATIGVAGWSFAGWATASASNTEVAPTLYAASSNYKPSDNITLYAVYKFTEGTEGEYIRVTKLADVKAASKVILVNGGKTLTTDLSAKDALSESEGTVTAADKTVFTLSGNDTDGYTLTGAGGTIGAASLPTSNGNYTSISITSSNNTWSITSNSSTTNTFTFLNKGGTNVGLEYYSSGSAWVVYKTSSPTSSSYYATKVYIPNFATVYNSNPAAIVNPTVAWTTSGDKTLYLKNTYTYDNAANVTGIAKTPVYTSSDATVATVSEAGVVTALKVGETTITAKVAKEVGVNTEASVNYVVTVKDASNIAGLKEVATSSSATSFTADLTNAVVTYVNGSYAYIEDASGAIYASCGSSLTAGKKINGAVSGSVKVSYQIDEITTIDLSDATVEDGVIPSAIVQTTAQVVANKATLEGKLVSVTGAKVTASLTNGNASGGKIKTGTDDEINLYAPASNIDALKDAEGTFNGYISLYNGGLRFNIYEQSQISLTRNAPTAQPLTFVNDAVELGEETDAYSSFTGQAVSGAQGTVTYSIDSDDDGVVTSIDDETGDIVLSGEFGTATIKASAAAKEVTEAGVTTPYTETTETYTITVYPRYTVTFSVNGTPTVLRQESNGGSIEVPENPADILGYEFMGWSESTVAVTDTPPSMADLSSGTVTPASNTTYYAVFAVGVGTPIVNHTSTFTVKQASAPSSPYVNDGSSWTWNDVTFANSASAYMGPNSTISFTLPSGGKAVSLAITSTSNTWAGSDKVVVNLTDNSSNAIKTFTTSSLSYEFSSTYDHATSYTLTAPSDNSKNAWVDHITFAYTTGGVTYKDYLTTIPTTTITLAAACTDGEGNYYGTYSNSSAFIVPEGLTVSTIGIDGEGKLDVTEYEEGDIVKANTGMMVSATSAGAKSIATTRVTGIENDGNLLKPSGDAGISAANMDEDDTKFYRLTMHNGTDLGFWWGAADGAAFNLAANKAYLAVPDGVAEVKGFMLFPDIETGVKAIDNAPLTKDNVEIFNLAGQKINRLQKGINIVNGRKVLVK